LTKISGIQLSIAQQPIATGEWVSPPTRTHQKTRIKQYNSSTDHWKQSSKLIPNYIKLSGHVFKNLLSQAIPSYSHQIEQILGSTDMLRFIRLRAKLMCTCFQLKIEQDYWNYIANLNMPVVTWLSEVSKDVTQQNSINWDHTKTETNIKHRQKIIANKLQQAEIDLYIHLQQHPSSSSKMQNKMCFEHKMNIIFNALVVLIRSGLHRFHTNFQQKKILLQFDINDAHIVKSFYDFNPSKEQVRIYSSDISLLPIYFVSYFVLDSICATDVASETEIMQTSNPTSKEAFVGD